MRTLYEFATEQMLVSISTYFAAVEKTEHFTSFNTEDLEDDDIRLLLLAGKAIDPEGVSPTQAQRELERVHSVAFDVEQGASYSVYRASRAYIRQLMEKANALSAGYTSVSPNDIASNAYLLPIWQAALAIQSKAQMKTLFGTVSDQHISVRSAEKIATYANNYFADHTPTDSQIIERTARTLEGIVRDLVGRLLFESIVKRALEDVGVPYVPEDECSGLSGVIYSHRPDFVIPNERHPLAFIEVRKSSSRHASLYAKDKMFSAINWKGAHQDMLGIIVTEGEWTQESLMTMAKVFDYVVPVSRSIELAENIKNYIEGDNSILKWIVNFSIRRNGEQ